MTQTHRSEIALHCPACRGDITGSAAHYHCGTCGRDYPVLFGIADFRLQGDLYLSLEDERAKAARLHEYARDHDFAELVDFYYAITEDVPPDLARKFAAYVLDAPARMRPVLSALQPIEGASRLLDVGCASGGALVAGGMFGQRVGVDIALRWLVICRKRLEELGVMAQLICADVEALPFRPGQFTHVLANDLIEHVRSPPASVAACAAQLAGGGRLYLSASNRWWPGPHPAVGIWAAGLMPRGMRSAVAMRLKGIDVLRHARFVSAAQVRGWLRDAGLAIADVAPKRTGAPGGAVSAARAAMIGAYRFASKIPGLSRLMVAAGPAFDIIAIRPGKG